MAQKRRVSVETGKAVARPDFEASPAALPGREQRSEPPREDNPDLCTCPRLERADWHEVESDFSDATFLRTSLTAAMGVPLAYQGARQRLEAEASKIGATVPDDAMILLGEGRFRRPVLLEVEGAKPGTRGLLTLGGVAFSRLVPAPLGQMKQAVADTVAMAIERYGEKPDDVWLWYLTCRICSGPRDFETLILAHYRDRAPA
jgi:hypothetical protein